jgi:hypothetical protein
MRSAIAVIMAILGVILVLSGAAALWASALARPRETADAATPITRVDQSVNALSRLPAPDRLITWGVILLALSAVAAGAITFSATATAGTN